MDDGELEKLIDLPKLVKQALETSELAPLVQESGVKPDEIVARVRLKLDDFVSITGDAAATVLRLGQERAAATAKRDKDLKELGEPRSGWWLVFYGGLALGMTLLGTGLEWWTPLHRWREFLSLGVSGTGGGVPWWWRGLSLLIGVSLFLVWVWSFGGLFLWPRQRKVHRELAAGVTGLDSLAFLEKGYEAQRDQLRKMIYDRGVRPEVNGILSTETAVSYKKQLPHAERQQKFTATGLTEVFVSAHEVETAARHVLDDWLKLPGGSIGLSGPRGAGKTTLMTLVARRPGKKGKACQVMCAAPVEYTGRDYLVTLFLLLCKWVLEDRGAGSGQEGPSAPATERPWEWLAGLAAVALPRLSRYALYGGLIVLMTGLTLGWLNTRQQLASERAAAVATAAMQPAAGKAAESKTGGKIDSGGRAAAGTGAGSTEPMTLVYLRTVGVDAAKLTGWGFMLLGAGVVMGYFLPYAGKYWEARERTRINPFSIRFPGLSVGDDPRQPGWQRDELADMARQHLDRLRFLQSYTSGWSGSLKLPFGMEGGANEARTMSGQQRSLPELVSDFRDFLQRVATEYGRVTICIDELDKLESDDKAHLFLNEIKAVFGVQNVFYLVSVSENAISAFERRGLPFRDVFDSAFDAIVHVDYLTLHESKMLLKRRTTKVPEPFLCVCHAMSGGLPRDLIRACREMLRVASEEAVWELTALTRRVIAEEVRGKARGMSIAASKLVGDADQTAFLSNLTELLTTADLDEARLLGNSRTLLGLADGLRKRMAEAEAQLAPTERGTMREEVVQASALAELETEFGLYLCYVATVEEIVETAGQDQWETTAEGSGKGWNVFEAATRTRQSLAVSTSVGRQRLAILRTLLGLDAGGIVAAKSEKGIEVATAKGVGGEAEVAARSVENLKKGAGGEAAVVSGTNGTNGPPGMDGRAAANGGVQPAEAP